MPVPIKLRDNASTVKVRTTSPDNIKVKSDCDIEKTRLDSLIQQEKAERIEADIILQAELINKQERIEFIYLNDISGTLDISSLNLLADNLVNRLVLDHTIYYLSIRQGNVRKYFTTQSVAYNEIDVNMDTGYYVAIPALNPIVSEHIADSNIHVSDSDRTFWDNKVTSYLSAQDEENLVLTKN